MTHFNIARRKPLKVAVRYQSRAEELHTDSLHSEVCGAHAASLLSSSSYRELIIRITPIILTDSLLYNLPAPFYE